jgi:predicted MPP superfamily phosphohydrolase
VISRRNLLKGLLGTSLAGLLAGLDAFVYEPLFRLRVQRWAVTSPGWGGAPPLRIAVVTDLHMGAPYVTLPRLQQVVEMANALEPDLTVLLGDYAAGHHFLTARVKIADAAPVLAGLRARLGTFAILGNHDWWDDLSAQRRGGGPNLYADALETVGIPVLSNRAIKLEGFWLAGLEDQLALNLGRGRFQGLDDLPGTLAQIADVEPVILLAHEPDIFPNVPDRVALTLSGHTHGGQVRLFGWSPVVPSRYGNRFAYGHVEEDSRHLVVSGGIGCSIAPIRFGMPPEITLVELS